MDPIGNNKLAVGSSVIPKNPAAKKINRSFRYRVRTTARMAVTINSASQADHLDSGQPGRPEIGALNWIVQERIFKRWERFENQPAYPPQQSQRDCCRPIELHAQPCSLPRRAGAESDVPEQHQARQDRSVLLGKDPHRGGHEQGRRDPGRRQARQGGTANINQESAEDGHGRQEVRSAGDVGDGLGSDGVNRPQCGREEGWQSASKQLQGEKKNQPDIAQVEKKIDPMIPSGVVPISKDCIVHQQGGRRHRAV